MLAFDGHDHDLIEGGVHAVELKFGYQVEELGWFHQMVLLRLSRRVQSAMGRVTQCQRRGREDVGWRPGLRWRAKTLRTTSAEWDYAGVS
jgi:hypothetical protein